MIHDRIKAQQDLFERVENHLKSEMAFRQRVLDRERNVVMQLIEEWERQEPLCGEKESALTDAT